MGLTLVFSDLLVLLSHMWEKEKKEKGQEGKRNRREKEGGRKEDGIKKDWRKEKKKEF